jgi:hypothetical protein
MFLLQLENVPSSQINIPHVNFIYYKMWPREHAEEGVPERGRPPGRRGLPCRDDASNQSTLSPYGNLAAGALVNPVTGAGALRWWSSVHEPCDFWPCCTCSFCDLTNIQGAPACRGDRADRRCSSASGRYRVLSPVRVGAMLEQDLGQLDVPVQAHLRRGWRPRRWRGCTAPRHRRTGPRRQQLHVRRPRRASRVRPHTTALSLCCLSTFNKIFYFTNKIVVFTLRSAPCTAWSSRSLMHCPLPLKAVTRSKWTIVKYVFIPVLCGHFYPSHLNLGVS